MFFDFVCESTSTSSFSLGCKWTISQVSNSWRYLWHNTEQQLITSVVTLDSANSFLLASQCTRETAGGKYGVQGHLPLWTERPCSFSVNRGTQITPWSSPCIPRCSFNAYELDYFKGRINCSKCLLQRRICLNQQLFLSHLWAMGTVGVINHVIRLAVGQSKKPKSL